jgi:hypothetical protein
MFNAGKTLFFIVAIITSAAFLFFVPHFHMPHKLASLITIHRIETALKLLSPIIFGAITAYIAYQQHCLAKTQANISRDQRDIAHNKLRVENYEKMFEIQDFFLTFYEETMGLKMEYPHEIYREIHNDIENMEINEIPDLLNMKYSEKVREWAQSYIEKEQKLYEMAKIASINSKKCLLMFDEKTNNSILKFVISASRLHSIKSCYITSSLYDREKNILKERVFNYSSEFEELMHDMIRKMKPYMDIRDIMAPRKLAD